jgi:hypothetical protein
MHETHEIGFVHFVVYFSGGSAIPEADHKGLKDLEDIPFHLFEVFVLGSQLRYRPTSQSCVSPRWAAAVP